MRYIALVLPLISVSPFVPMAQAQGPRMNHLYQLKDAKTRSISPENFTGEKGRGGMATLDEGSAAHAARELGQGWKVNPFVVIDGGEIRPRVPFLQLTTIEVKSSQLPGRQLDPQFARPYLQSVH